MEHYRFIVNEVFRLTKPGRLSCVHCCDLKRGIIYQKDFPGDLVRMHEEAGFGYFCRVAIWKDPWEFARRTRMKTLMHKTVVQDSSTSRIAPADYVLIFRKPGANAVPITHTQGFKHYAGGTPIPAALREYLDYKGDQRKNLLSHWIYRQYASPIWMDVRRGRLIACNEEREDPEEKHVCLARGSLVLTKGCGYVPIQDVMVGQEVLTHRGRWRPVLAVENTGIRPTIEIHAQGVPGLAVTLDHRVWARKSAWVRQREGAEHTDPQWIEAQSLLSGYVNLPLPETRNATVTDLRHWWIVGRWLACGHWDSRGGLHISYGDDKREALIEHLGDVAGSERHTGAAWQIRLLDPDGSLRETVGRCGHGAAGKHLPPEAFVLPEAQAKAILDGYLAGDGHFLNGRQRWTGNSVSRSLLLGMAMLAQRVYHTIASVYAGQPEGEHQIEGRTVNCQQQWVLCFDLHDADRYKKPFILEDGAWKKVRSLKDAGEQETWNLQVAEDESYTAEGCVVKNCRLQLDVIERCLAMWSNPKEIMLTPFAGVGSEVFQAVRMGRRAIGCELKGTYFRQAVENVPRAYLPEEDELPMCLPTDDDQGSMFNDDAEWLNGVTTNGTEVATDDGDEKDES